MLLDRIFIVRMLNFGLVRSACRASAAWRPFQPTRLPWSIAKYKNNSSVDQCLSEEILRPSHRLHWRQIGQLLNFLIAAQMAAITSRLPFEPQTKRNVFNFKINKCFGLQKERPKEEKKSEIMADHDEKN